MSIFEQYHRRLFLLYGQTDDKLCLPSLELLSVEEALHRHLQELGYERIVFYSMKDQLYSYDPQSIQLCFPGEAPLADTAVDNAAPRRRLSGLSRRHGIQGRLTASRATGPRVARGPTSEDRYRIRMDAERFVDSVRQWTSKREVKTAVILRDPLPFARETKRSLTNFVQHRLLTVDRENQNVIILLLEKLPAPDGRSPQDEWEEWCGYASILNTTVNGRELLASESSHRVGPPSADEIRSAMLRERARRRSEGRAPLQFEFSSLDRDAAAIARSFGTSDPERASLSHFDATALRRANSIEDLCRNEQAALESLGKFFGTEPLVEWLKPLGEMAQDSAHSKAPHVGAVPRRLHSPEPRVFESPFSFHWIFTGPSGTGKTSIAREMARALQELDILPRGHLVEVTREHLVSEYVGATALRTIERIEEADGGVLFVDEAYRLLPQSTEKGHTDYGAEALETILAAMENRRDRLAVVLAGYAGLEERLVQFNEGFRSRFSNILRLQRLTPPQLAQVFRKQIEERGLSASTAVEEHLTLFFEGWVAQQPADYGEARAVRTLVENLSVNHHRRGARSREIDVDDFPESTRDLFNHARPPSVQELLASLDDLVGLRAVKTALRHWTNAAIFERGKGEAQLPPSDSAQVFVFEGNPGTGKTEVARRFAELLFRMGAARRNALVERVPGQLEDNSDVESAMREARGGVLFVDEAHQFLDDPRRLTAFRAFISTITDPINACTTIIFAGYPGLPSAPGPSRGTREEAATLANLMNVDPGMSRRVKMTFRFEDFNPDELFELFARRAKKESEVISTELESSLRRLFRIWCARRRPQFGNAGDVFKFFQSLKDRRASRVVEGALVAKEAKQLSIADLPEDAVALLQEAGDSLGTAPPNLDDLVGLEAIKATFEGMTALKQAQERRGEGSVTPGHFIFAGPPGTGKTTVAERFGQLMASLGLLESGHVVRCTRADLTGPYVGDPEHKTREQISKAAHGVLFIDEAYTLSANRNGDDVGPRIMAQLIETTTNPPAPFVLVLAGYSMEMRRLCEENPGTLGRFQWLDFPGYDDAALREVFRGLVPGKWLLDPGVEDRVLEELASRRAMMGSAFPNARAVTTLWSEVCSRQAMRIANDDAANAWQVTVDDIPGEC